MTAPIPPQDSPRAGAGGSGRRFVGYLAAAGELVAARRFREAEIEILRALSGGPTNLRALNLLALVRFKLGRLDEARATYREIAGLSPKDPGARRNLGLLALKAEELDEAVRELEQAARLAPDDRRAWGYLGYAYARRGETAAAVDAFRRAGQEAIARELEANAGAREAHDEARDARETNDETYDEARDEPAAAGSLQVVAEAADGFGDPAVTGVGSTGLRPLVVTAPALEAPPTPLVSFALAALGLGPALGLEPPLIGGAPVRLSSRGGLHVRAGAALASAGVMPSEPALRRIRGRSSGEVLGSAARPFFRLSGDGEVWIAGKGNRHVALALEDDILYVREERVLAFDGGVSWEAGRVPGDGLQMLQFRGRGSVVLQLSGTPSALRVSEDVPARVSRAHLLGWVGRIIARKAHDQGPLPIECEGEGVLLLDRPKKMPKKTQKKSEKKAQKKTKT